MNDLGDHLRDQHHHLSELLRVRGDAGDDAPARIFVVKREVVPDGGLEHFRADGLDDVANRALGQAALEPDRPPGDEAGRKDCTRNQADGHQIQVVAQQIYPACDDDGSRRACNGDDQHQKTDAREPFPLRAEVPAQAFCQVHIGVLAVVSFGVEVGEKAHG